LIAFHGVGQVAKTRVVANWSVVDDKQLKIRVSESSEDAFDLFLSSRKRVMKDRRSPGWSSRRGNGLRVEVRQRASAQRQHDEDRRQSMPIPAAPMGT
jgi:hypothetical protein